MNLIKVIISYSIIIILTLFLLLPLQACHTTRMVTSADLYKTICTKPYKVKGKWYKPIIKTKGFQESGIASWYGEKFHGRKTSSKKIYNMHAMTAAHKTLPLNCWVHVLNSSNNKGVNVKITDRGPFIKNRIIDLSYAAAKKIGMLDDGISKVKITYLGKRKITKEGLVYIQPNYQSAPLSIQVGSFYNLESAEKLKNKLVVHPPYQIDIIPFERDGRTFYRVSISNFQTFRVAKQYQKSLKKQGYTECIVLSTPK